MSLKGTVWSAIGPSPIAESSTSDNGMTTAIAVSPNNPNVIYQGTAAGGVWHSIDAGATWIPIFDRQAALGIGEPAGIAIDPHNTSVVYVGTSSRVAGTGQRAGLFKSTDGGASCVALGSGYPADNVGNASQFVDHNINVIIVDPVDSDVVYLGSGGIPALGSRGGVFRSQDGGQNWTRGINAVGDARSLVLDLSSPAAARTLYAGLAGVGVIQSTDGGVTWTQLLSGTTPAVAAAVGPAPKSFGRVVVALAPPTSPPDPAGVRVLYVTLSGSGGALDPVGVFLSTDQGATWTQRAGTGMPMVTYGGYCLHMAVDPASPGDGSHDIIYFGSRRQAKSTDSGTTFNAVSGPPGQPHADTHTWTLIPQSAPAQSVVYVGTDGGIARSGDGGATWTPLNGGGLQTGLFYNIAVKPDATASVTVGALQDNEVETTAGAALPGWRATSGGDGWDVAFDGVIAGQVYSSSGFYGGSCTQVFVSTDDGVSWAGITPWTTSDSGCYLAPLATDPNHGGVVYVSGSQNLWQSRDGGGTWRIIGTFGSTGNVAVANVDGNHVVIAVGGRVFVSANALAPTVGSPSGVTFTDITRNLPRRNGRAIFDPGDPTVIYAVLGGFSGAVGGHVFRTTVTATGWTDISPALDVPFGAIAIDGTDTPAALYVGTDLGVLRSVDNGASWSVLDDLHFPRVPVYDLVVSQPARVLRAATYGRGVFEFVRPTGPVIALNLQDGLDFGTICRGPAYLTLQIFNVGVNDLLLDSVQRLMGSNEFMILSSPDTPLLIAPGDEVDFTVMFSPTTAVSETATIRIVSNDPAAPIVDIAVTGTGGTARLQATVVNAGDFGHVCVGSHADQLLTINNTGSCPLSVSSITSFDPDFEAPDVISYPLEVSAGGSIDVVIRFKPSNFGAKSSTISIFSNDPVGPHTIAVSGDCPAPRLHLMIASTGTFAKICVGYFTDETLILNNSGRCTLSITDIASSSAEFITPETLAYPITVAAGTSLAVPIRFEPTNFGVKNATLTVSSDDPAGPHTIPVSGDAPSGRLTVTGSTAFDGVRCCRREQRIVSLCNTGECDLHVSHVGFKHERRHLRLINNPFPATIRPGSSLSVILQYRAVEKVAKPCELIIHSNDPHEPVRAVEVIAYTIWQCSEYCGKECCPECWNDTDFSCREHHKDCCEEQSQKCCDHHDERRHDASRRSWWRAARSMRRSRR